MIMPQRSFGADDVIQHVNELLYDLRVIRRLAIFDSPAGGTVSKSLSRREANGRLLRYPAHARLLFDNIFHP
jgi:hypothetical protein